MQSTSTSRLTSLFVNFKVRQQEIKRSATVLMMLLIISASVPPAIAAAASRDVVAASSAATKHAWISLNNWLKSKKSSQEQETRGVKPRPPESRSDREVRVASLEMNPSDSVVLQSRQPMLFSAIPVDANGTPIHGLHAEWSSTNTDVVFIKKSGQAVAGKPGHAVLQARAGYKTETVKVTVIEGSRNEYGPTKPDTVRRQRRVSLATGSSNNTSDERKRNHPERGSSSDWTKRTNALMVPQRPPVDDPLPDNETNSLYQPSNAVGSPPGKRKPGAASHAVATDGTETNGNQNFTFALPIAGLPGRGLDASVSLVYNSQLWNKSTDPSDSSTWMSYDVDSGWPAPGFRLSLGQIENQGSFGFTLTDPDGTRHGLSYTSTNNYDTTDGTFIHYTGGSSSGKVYYPDGTIAYYGCAAREGFVCIRMRLRIGTETIF